MDWLVELALGFISAGTIAGWIRSAVKGSKYAKKVSELVSSAMEGSEAVDESQDVVSAFSNWFDDGSEEDWEKLVKEFKEAKVEWKKLLNDSEKSE